MLTSQLMTTRISSVKTREVNGHDNDSDNSAFCSSRHLAVSAVILISSIQSFIYDRKREKREREQATRDAEYHENRMKLLEK